MLMCTKKVKLLKNAVFDHGPQGIMVFNRKGKVTDVNPAALKIIDMDLKSIINQHHDTLYLNFKRLDGTYLESEDQPVKRVLLTGEVQTKEVLQVFLRRPKGPLHLSMTAVAIKSAFTKRVQEVYVFFEDVSAEVERSQLNGGAPQLNVL